MAFSDRHLSTSSHISGSATPHFAMSAAAETSRRGDATRTRPRRTASSIPSRYETLPRADTAREGSGLVDPSASGTPPGRALPPRRGHRRDFDERRGEGFRRARVRRVASYEDPSLVPGPGQYTARHRVPECAAAPPPVALRVVGRRPRPDEPRRGRPGPGLHPERPRLEELVGESAFRSATRGSAPPPTRTSPSARPHTTTTSPRYRTSFAPATAGASHPRAPSRPSASAHSGPSPRAPPVGSPSSRASPVSVAGPAAADAAAGGVRRADGVSKLRHARGETSKDGGSPEGGGRRGSSLTPRTRAPCAAAAAGSAVPAACRGGFTLAPPPRWSLRRCPSSPATPRLSSSRARRSRVRPTDA